MIKEHKDTFTFGPFLVDAKERVLMRGSNPVPLTPKVFATLLVLVENAGHILEKDELMKLVWPDSYVEEANLAQNIFKLRQVLGKNRSGKPYIETIPRRGYRFLASVKQSTPAANGVRRRKAPTEISSTTKHSESQAIQSIAILPLTNTSRDENLEYLSDGITESIINSLSRLPQLRVMARSSVFSYKGREVDPKDVGRQLQVRTLLTGKVFQVNEQLVIRVELVETSTGYQLWGEQYNHRLADILEVQEEIAKQVSEQLSLKLTGDQQRQLIKRHTESIEAYHLYLKGRFFWNKHEKVALRKSIRCFEKAIELDQNYALALAGLADSYQRLSNLTLAPHRALPKARAAAAQAVALDDTLPEAHCAWGWIKIFHDHDWQGAETALKRAIDLNPGAPLAHQRYGGCLTFLGRFEDALKELRLAHELDPLSIQIAVNMAMALSVMERHGEAVRVLRQTLELEPSARTIHYTLACAHRRQGNYAAALRAFEKLRKLDPDSDLALGSIGHVLALSGDRVGAKKILGELIEMSKRRYISPYSIGVIHIGLRNVDEAFKWIEKLYKESNDWLVWLGVGPEFDPLRSDARFDSLLRRIGLS